MNFGISLVLFFSSLSYGWSGVYHNAIVMDAMQQLHPAAKKKVEGILGPRAYEYGSWADKIRQHDQRYSKWHVMPAEQIDAACLEQSNLKCGIITASQVLAHHRQGIPEDVALKLLIHLVADAHQPLHITFPHFYNGRCFVKNDRVVNFHLYMDRYAVKIPHGSIQDYADMISLVREKHSYNPNLNVRQWLRESSELQYRIMPGLIEGDVPSYCKIGKETVQPYVMTLGMQQQLRDISLQQMAKSSQRLALLLNRIYDSGHRVNWQEMDSESKK